MKKDHLEHLTSFINEFVPRSHKKEWLKLASFEAPQLDDIEPHDIWPENNNEIPNCTMLESNFFEFIRNEPYAKYSYNEVTVIPCGHDDNVPSTMKLKDVLDGDHYLLERVISIIKGKLALLVNHDGEACIFNNLKNT